MARLLGGQLPQHMMVCHILSVGKKTWIFDRFNLAQDIYFFPYSTWQKRFIEERRNVPAERVTFTPFMVDAQFFSPDQVTPGESELSRQLDDGRPLICAVGLERRDYPTLMKAVEGLDVHLVVAAGSPWSKRKDTTEGEEIPDNVTVQRFSQHELRQLYADSRFLVIPLFDVDFQAGVTTMLEAMAMGKSMICSRTPGQTEVIVEGETGVYVTPGLVHELRESILSLLSNADHAAEMGRAGRRVIDEQMSLDRYVSRLGEHVESHL
ncbi:MAG: glycosyltransferase involved in cell wall biosynthesis [Pseudohongiellaceae bacterium]|jgi:glycosyltransferase involved in cell wall biosynthesis